MAVQYYWHGGSGPLAYNDEDLMPNEEPGGELQQAFRTTGQGTVEGTPTEPYNVIRKVDFDEAVTGPATGGSTASAIARWDGTDGRLLKNSVVIVDDGGSLTGILNVTATGFIQGTTGKFTNLTDGKIPYHVDDATGLADGPIKTDVDSAVSLKHAAVTVSAPIVLTGQAIELKNNAGSPAQVTAIDIGALANSDTVVPTSKAVTTALADKLDITSLVLPFYIADGTLDTIPLTSDQKLPFYNAAGASKDIVLTT
jgi:hypothetical protein